jgi:hypothetical protein
MTQTSDQTTAVAATTTTSVTPIFGVVLVLNGQQVPISGIIGDIQTKGFKFNLPQPVTIGSPADFLGWLDQTFGTTLKTTLNPANLPAPLANLVNQLLNLEISVIKADINIPPQSSTDSVTYTIELSAAFSGNGIQLIPGSNVLLLQGGVAGVTNDPNFTG